MDRELELLVNITKNLAIFLSLSNWKSCGLLYVGIFVQKVNNPCISEDLFGDSKNFDLKIVNYLIRIVYRIAT